MGKCRVCGIEVNGSGRRYCEDHVPPVTTGGGYIKIYLPGHHRSDKAGYVQEHFVVIEEKIGRSLKPKESIHHIDGNRKNNSPDNLMLFDSIGDHLRFHAIQRNRAIAKELESISRQEWLACWYALEKPTWEMGSFLKKQDQLEGAGLVRRNGGGVEVLEQ